MAKKGIAEDFRPGTPADLAVCLADPMWRLCSGQLYQIMLKSAAGEDMVVPFRPNRAQRRLMARLWHRNIILKARQLGFCVDPGTRVLTAELKWERIADLKAGDEVVAVDEHPPGGRGKARRMRTATVQAVQTVQRMAYRIAFDDGREVVCTDMHPWLTRKAGDRAQWRSISGRGNEVVGKIKVGTAVRWITKPWGAPTAEDGWFGGMLDGEGSIAKAAHAAGINVSQRPGPVWDRLVAYAEDRGYNARIESDTEQRDSKHGLVPVPKLSFGRLDEMLRLIGHTRPTRFIGNRFWDGRELPGKRNGGVGWSTVTSIEPLGQREMVDLQTSTGTYIAEGFVSHNTTLICLIWLDHALFNADQRCGIIAQDREAAEIIFRDKIKLAYDRLPPEIRAAMPLARDSASELLFAHNNSSIRVATSMRSGTLHRLHVSEFGKICAKFPDKAREVVTGSLPSVPIDGISIIESTAEGREGSFYDMTQRAMALDHSKSKLTARDYRFHFFAWWQEPGYRIESGDVVITDRDRNYFEEVEREIGQDLDEAQRRWYVATRESDFQGSDESMWQEYPSTPDEAFKVSKEGKYFAAQLAAARKAGRITSVPHVDGIAVNTFWDIGKGDGTAVWLHQQVGLQHRFIGFIEGWDEPYSFYVRRLQALEYMWGAHYLPHDAEHKRQQADVLSSAIDELRKSPLGGTWAIVPRVDDFTHGIQLTRSAFSQAWIDEESCKEGIAHLDNYSKKWNAQAGCWHEYPIKNVHTEAADAFRQWAQSLDSLNGSDLGYDRRRDRNWKTA
jgi:hypothetical protein